MKLTSIKLLPFPIIVALAACGATDQAAPNDDAGPQDATRPYAFDAPPPDVPSIHRSAVVTVSCHIAADGVASGCAVRDVKGDASFAQPALEYARSVVYLPGFRTGTAPVEPDHLSYIAFQPATRFFPRDMKASLAILPQLQYPASVTDQSTGVVRLDCTVQADGSVSDCTVLSVDGAAAFGDAALKTVRKAHYTPAWRHGHAVPEPHHAIQIVFLPPFPNIPVQPKDIVFSKPVFTTRLRPPPAMMNRKVDANVLVVCDVGLDGANHNCTIGGVHGDPSFGTAALDYVMSETIHATRNGIPVEVPRHAMVIGFNMGGSQW